MPRDARDVPGDELDDDERERLHDAIEESEAQIEAGQVFPAEEVLAALRARH
jgi:predicted transcriptional regulator